MPSVLQDLAIGRRKEAIESRFPIAHGHGDLAQRHVLGDIEVGAHEPRELRQLGLVQVVLGHDDIELLDLAERRVRPRVEPHALLGCVGAGDDDLGGSLSVDGPVELVLHHREEALRAFRRHVVVDGGRVDVGDLLVKLALRQTDLADALELLFEVPVAQDRTAALHALGRPSRSL